MKPRVQRLLSLFLTLALVLSLAPPAAWAADETGTVKTDDSATPNSSESITISDTTPDTAQAAIEFTLPDGVSLSSLKAGDSVLVSATVKNGNAEGGYSFTWDVVSGSAEKVDDPGNSTSADTTVQCFKFPKAGSGEIEISATTTDGAATVTGTIPYTVTDSTQTNPTPPSQPADEYKVIVSETENGPAVDSITLTDPEDTTKRLYARLEGGTPSVGRKCYWIRDDGKSDRLVTLYSEYGIRPLDNDDAWIVRPRFSGEKSGTDHFVVKAGPFSRPLAETTIDIIVDVPNYDKVIGDYVIDKDGYLKEYRGTDTVLTVPEGVLKLYTIECGNSLPKTVTKVTLPKSLKTLHNISHYYELQEVVCLGSPKLMSAPFDMCPKLEKVDFGYIADPLQYSDRFFYCNSLREIIIRGKVERVEYDCIPSTVKNVAIYYTGTTQEWLAAEKEGAFPGVIVIGGPPALPAGTTLTQYNSTLTVYCSNGTVKNGAVVSNAPNTIPGGTGSTPDTPTPGASYTITYSAGTGTGSMDSTTVEAGERLTLPACGFTAPAGQQFKGWRVGSSSTVYQPSDRVVITGNTTVTAVWDDGDYGNYYVSVRTSRHGSVLPDVEYASSGSRVTLTVSPDRGYELEEISVTNSRTGSEISVRDSGNDTYRFTMPDDDVRVEASFQEVSKDYSITVRTPSHGSVSSNADYASSGNRVTLTVTPSRGYELEDITVTNKKTGDVISVSSSRSDKYRFTMPAANVTVEAFFREIAVSDPVAVNPPVTPAVPNTPNLPAAIVYADVRVTDWYYDGVQYMAQRGLMKGTSATEFDSHSNTTRAMVWTMLARMAGQSTDGGSNWYQKGMDWCIASGITDGSDPNGTITREQLATMLWRTTGSPASSAQLSQFSDSGKINAYAQDALRWATEHGIMNGKGGGMLDPQGLATRAEVAQMFMNYMVKTGA